jgi:hypothetical protein
VQGRDEPAAVETGTGRRVRQGPRVDKVREPVTARADREVVRTAGCGGCTCAGCTGPGQGGVEG